MDEHTIIAIAVGSLKVERLMDGLRPDQLAIVRPLGARRHLMMVLHGPAYLERVLLSPSASSMWLRLVTMRWAKFQMDSSARRVKCLPLQFTERKHIASSIWSEFLRVGSHEFAKEEIRISPDVISDDISGVFYCLPLTQDNGEVKSILSSWYYGLLLRFVVGR